MLDIALETMISQQLVGRGVVEARVLNAFREVKRQDFAPEYLESKAYANTELPIGLGQTISAPYAMARMLQELNLQGTERVLEIGTGSGFQAALLARLASEVYTLEILPELGARAKKRLIQLMGIKNIIPGVGDGYYGWSEHAPFDAIIVNGAAPEVPSPLIGQLREGGVLVMAIAEDEEAPQELHVLRCDEDGDISTTVISADDFNSRLPMLSGEIEDF